MNPTPTVNNFRSDLGPFSIVPEWVVDLDIPHGALRLYAVLGRYANSDGDSWPSRTTLAARLRTSRDTVDRWTKELVSAGALLVTHRKDTTAHGNKVNRTNLYTLRYARPDVAAPTRLPSCDVAARGSSTDAAQNDNQLELKPENEELFEIFWVAYDKKVGKKAARTQWRKHISTEALGREAIAGAQRQAASVEKKFRKDPERWIRDHRWQDDEVLVATGSAGTLARLQQRVNQEGL
jgi:hypothetical protein